MSEKLSISKLKGQANYAIWKLRTQSLLTERGFISALLVTSNTSTNSTKALEIDSKALATIVLLVEDGPLLQIQNAKTAIEAWSLLENLYSPKGFTSDFLVCKEFFSTTLNKFSNIEEYINRVKELSNQLKEKQLELPKQVIVAWILNNLDPSYNSFVATIIQGYRQDSKSINLEDLFSNLIDESKRINSLDSKETILYSSKKSFKSIKNRITKDSNKKESKYCTKCKVKTHSTKNCFYLFPNKAPSQFKTKAYYQKEEDTEEEDIEPKSKDINLYLDRPKSTSKISKLVLINRAKAKKAVTLKE